MPHVARLAVHPAKSLDPEARERVTVLESGALAGDREYAMVDADNEYVNGKRTAAVHRLRSAVTLENGHPAALDLRAETEDAPERLRRGERFEHFFKLAVNTRRPGGERVEVSVAVGDPVAVEGA